MVARATIESLEVHVNDLYMLLLSLSLSLWGVEGSLSLLLRVTKAVGHTPLTT